MPNPKSNGWRVPASRYLKPIGPLMKEHRLIERVVACLSRKAGAMEAAKTLDRVFIREVTGFFTFYADKGHHGKEEDILFRALAARPMTQEHKSLMQGLLQDHARGRELVASLSAAVQVKDAARVLRNLQELYDRHIAKEDKQFFVPSMAYFTKQEQDDMLVAFWEFDKNLLYEKYRIFVEHLEHT